jgi:hypothetical protein
MGSQGNRAYPSLHSFPDFRKKGLLLWVEAS